MQSLLRIAHVLMLCMVVLVVVNRTTNAEQAEQNDLQGTVPTDERTLDLKQIPYKIIYETYRHTQGRENWELYVVNADGSNLINLTNTPEVNEMYPHVSPDGTKICFVVDEGIGRSKVRSVYYMNIDGTQRVKIARNARQPCWSFDSQSIAYLKGEYDRYTTREYATNRLMIYDVQTDLHRQHPNKTLQHIYAICWSPRGKWFLAAVHGGMAYSDTILAFEGNGTRLFDLGVYGVKGCRPDMSRDGKIIVWGETDWNLCAANIDLESDIPDVNDIRDIVRCQRQYKVYHVDISPDGRHIAFSYGPHKGGQQVGGKAKGWNICVGDLQGNWVQITTDGNHNKEPDWVPMKSSQH
jgi:Tol biopolymer transport system component